MSLVILPLQLLGLQLGIHLQLLCDHLIEDLDQDFSHYVYLPEVGLASMRLILWKSNSEDMILPSYLTQMTIG